MIYSLFLHLFKKVGMAGPKIAKTTSANGPDDKLIVVDVYEEDGSQIENSYQETHPESLDVLDGLDGGGAGGEKTPEELIEESFDGMDDYSANNDLEDLTGDFDPTDPWQLDDYLTGGDNDLLGDFNSLSDKLQDFLRSGIQGLDDIYADLNGAVSKINGAISPRSMGGLTGLMNKLGCGYNPNISYRGSSIGFLSGLINAVSRLGLPGAFNAIANCISDPNVIGGVLRNVLPDVASRANIPLLNDIASSRVARDVIGVMPNIVGQTVRNLGRPTGMNQVEYRDYYNTASQSFSTIDGNWNSAIRGDYGRSLDATVVNSNEFFGDTLQSSVMSYPVSVEYNNAPNGNAAVVTYGPSGSHIATDRVADTAMNVVTNLAAMEVSVALRKNFSQVGAKLNRSVNIF